MSHPHVTIEAPFGDVDKGEDFRVLIALSQQAAFALLEVGWPSGSVQVMHGYGLRLHVHPRSHLLG
jgi:hypothetical protein